MIFLSCLVGLHDDRCRHAVAPRDGIDGLACCNRFVSDKPRPVLGRGNPDHLFHRGLATRTGNGA